MKRLKMVVDIFSIALLFFPIIAIYALIHHKSILGTGDGKDVGITIIVSMYFFTFAIIWLTIRYSGKILRKFPFIQSPWLIVVGLSFFILLKFGPPTVHYFYRLFGG